MNFHIFCAVLIVVNEWVSAFLEQVLGVARPAEPVRPASQDLVWGLPLPKSEVLTSAAAVLVYFLLKTGGEPDSPVFISIALAGSSVVAGGLTATLLTTPKPQGIEGQKASNVWLDSRYWKTWLVQIAIRQLAWSISIVICGAIVFVGILFLLIVASFFQ